MEINKNIKNENDSPTIINITNKLMNGAKDINNNKENETLNNNINLDKKNNRNNNSIPNRNRKISRNKVDYTNSSFITLRKNSDLSPKKKNDNSVTLNENNINFFSVSNLSNTNLINNKNESIFRKINLKENIKTTEKNSAVNKIDNIYKNKFTLKLRLNKDEIINKNKISNKLINRNFEKNKCFTKINKNKFILIRSKTFNYNNNSDLNRSRPSKLLNIYCFICNSYGEKLYHTKNCNHYFCKECGQNYFEQQVQRLIYTLKCPKYNCNNYLNLNNIKGILTPDTFIKLDTYHQINNKRISIKFNEKKLPNIILEHSKRNSLEAINNESFLGLNCLKKNFLKVPHNNQNNNKNLFEKKRHVFKIDNITKFKNRIQMENEKKRRICSKCKKPALFKRDDLNYIRCLNCQNVFCKYCLKKFNNSNNLYKNFFCIHCFRKRKKKIKFSCLTKMKYEILLVFGGFFTVIIGFTKYEVEFILKKKRKIFVLYTIFFIVIFIFNFIIVILFFPYFPAITMLFP